MKPCRHKLLAALTLWLLLAGCGPGVGGTGSGETGLAYFQATSALVCTSAIASTLDCAGTAATVAAPTTPEEGTSVVHYADNLADATVRVAFAANAIELDAPCKRLHFNGTWGISATSDARFFGTYIDQALRDPLPASLQVQTVTNDARSLLTVTVRDGAGTIVLGPVVLRRVDQAAPLRPGC